MKRYIRSEACIVTLMMMGMLAVNIYPWFLRILATPIHHFFLPVHNSLADYPWYTSVILQGLSGQPVIVDRFAVEPHAGSFLHGLYFVLGWVGRIFGATDAHSVYHASRIVLGGIWCIVMYGIIREFCTTKLQRILAFFFVLTSSSFIKSTLSTGVWEQTWYMTWWSGLDPTRRIDFIPHFTAGHIAMGGALLLLFRLMINDLRFKKLLFSMACICGFVAGFVHPPSLIILVMTIVLYSVVTRNIPLLFKSIIFSFVSCLSLLWLNSMSSVFPWSEPKTFEALSFALPIRDYLLSLGVVVPLGLFGAVISCKNKKTWFLNIWVIIPIIMIFLITWAPTRIPLLFNLSRISNIRFLQVAVWVPFGILSAYFVSWVFGKQKLVGWLVVIVYCFLTFVGYPATIREQATHVWSSPIYSYPDAGFMQAIMTLPKIVGDREAILSLPLAGQIIPTYINRTVYVGQDVYTPEHWPKTQKSYAFYHGSISVCEAYKLLRDSAVKAVFYGFDEQHAGNAVYSYSFLSSWNRYGTTEVFLFTAVAPTGCQ